MKYDHVTLQVLTLEIPNVSINFANLRVEAFVFPRMELSYLDG